MWFLLFLRCFDVYLIVVVFEVVGRLLQVLHGLCSFVSLAILQFALFVIPGCVSWSPGARKARNVILIPILTLILILILLFILKLMPFFCSTSHPKHLAVGLGGGGGHIYIYIYLEKPEPLNLSVIKNNQVLFLRTGFLNMYKNNRVLTGGRFN